MNFLFSFLLLLKVLDMSLEKSFAENIFLQLLFFPLYFRRNQPRIQNCTDSTLLDKTLYELTALTQSIKRINFMSYYRRISLELKNIFQYLIYITICKLEKFNTQSQTVPKRECKKKKKAALSKNYEK